MFIQTKKYIPLVISFAIIIFFSSNLFAAQRLLYENFDDRIIDERLYPRVVADGIDPVSPPRYQLSSPGRGDAGYCFASGTARDPFLEWRYDNTWPTNELYVSFWVRYPSRTSPDGDSHWNIKTFYPHFDGTSSYVHYSASGGGSLYHSAFGKGEMLTSSRWPTTPNDMNGNWHHYEFYIHFSQGISRFWYDGALKIDYNYGPSVWTNNVYYITFGGQDSTGANVFTRQIDNIEVWDGMPNGDQASGDDPVESDSLNPPTGLMVLQ